MYWMIGLLGALLAAAPFALHYDDHPAALRSSLILGLVLLALALRRGLSHGDSVWEYLAAGVVGLLAICAPFVLNFGTERTAPYWISILLGSATFVLASVAVFAMQFQESQQPC